MKFKQKISLVAILSLFAIGNCKDYGGIFDDQEESDTRAEWDDPVIS